MHLQTVVLDRVFDIQRRRPSRYVALRTDFSFEANGMTKYGVQVPGWPRLEAGDRLTVVLRKAGDWQTLLAWKNHITGELALPDTSRSIGRAFQALTLAMLAVFAYAESSSAGGRMASAGFGGFFALFALALCFQCWQERSLSRRLSMLE